MGNEKDGSIVIDTELDDDGFQKGSDKLLKAIDHLTRLLENQSKNMGQAASGVADSIRTTAEETSRAAGEAEKAASANDQAAGAARRYQSELSKVEKQIASTEAKLKDYYAELARIEESTNETLKFAETEEQVNHVLEIEKVEVDALNAKYAAQLAALEELKQRQADLQNAAAAAQASQQAAAEEAAATEAQHTATVVQDQHTQTQAVQQAAQEQTAAMVSANETIKQSHTSAFRTMMTNVRNYIAQARLASLQSNRLVRSLTSLKTMMIARIKRLFISSLMSNMSDSLKALQKYSTAYNDALKRMKKASVELSANISVAIANFVILVEPLITKLIDLLTKAVTKINMFFAALQGKTTVTVAHATQEYMESLEGAADAQKKLNNETYRFDELNKQGDPQKQESTPTVQYEEVPISEKIQKFANFLKEHLGTIKDLALGIGAAFAAWKIGSAILKLLGKDALGAKMSLLGFAAAIGGATVYTLGFLDAWKNGPSMKSLGEMLGGATVAAAGLGLAFKSLKVGAAALAVGGLGMITVAARDWIKQGQLTTDSFKTMEAGILSLGVGLALAIPGIGGAIAGIVALVAAGALAIYQYWDEIKAWLAGVWESLSTWFLGVKDGIVNWFTTTYWAISEWWESTAVPAIASAIDWIVQGFVDLGTELGIIWQQTLTLATTIGGAIRDFFVAAVNTIRVTAQVVATMVKQHWEQLKATTNAIWTAIKTTVVITANTIKSTLTSTITAAKNAVVAQWNALLASCKAIFSAIHSHVTSTIQSLTSFLSGTSWYGLGVNLMQGFLNGLRSLMSTIWNEVVEFVRRCTEAVRNALHIGSPSKVFEEIGRFTGEGFIIGIEGEQDAAVKTVKNLAGAVTDEMSGAVGNIDVSASGMDAIIAKLSETADIFKTIASTLSTIGGFSQPQISAGTVVPYKTQVDTSGTTENAKDEVATVLEEILAAIRNFTTQQGENRGDTHFHIVADGKEIFDLVVMENDRAINRTGASPLRV